MTKLIERAFPRLVASYEETANAIRLLIPVAAAPAFDDDEILEFLPE